MQSRRFRLTGAALLVGLVAIFAGSLVLRGDAVYSPLWDGWVGNAALLATALACFARAVLGGPRRAAAAWLGVGALCYTIGNVIYLAWTQFQTEPPVPSIADLFYLGLYPCIGAALFCLMRGDGDSPTKSLWLDGAVGAAGATTVLAAVLTPTLAGIEGSLAEILVGAAFPVGDLMLMAMICGLLAVRGLRGGSVWLWLAAGLAVFCVADVVYSLRVTHGHYTAGTPLDALWAIGLAIIGLAVWRPERPRRAVGDGRSSAIMAVPLLATLTAVVVLVIASFDRLTHAAVALATLTLLLAVARAIVSFRQVQRLSDARRQAVTDELTGLGNRRYLLEHGEQRLRTAPASERIALMMIDLDHFKEINDALGHHAGDEVLRETARRLAARVCSPDIAVRLGGDEFALVFTLAHGDDAREIADRVLDRMSQPLAIEGVGVRVEASAGVAERGPADASLADLLRRADVAMYAAKIGGSRLELYDPVLDAANHARLETVHDLDAALVNHQFVLHYQPKIDVRTGATTGAEALVRWEHPSRGLLYPDAFLPLVEQSGLMSAFTQIVLATAIEQLARWRAAGLELTVAVNMSASDLLDEHLPDRISALLALHGVPVTALELEITESDLMTDPARARRVLGRLQTLGLRMAVDDYGTGYCSLGYLRDFPVDELKIDRSFVSRVTADPRSAAIVRSTVELAHALDLGVVAEGVEDARTLEILTMFGCDFAQGYLFSRPVPAEAFAALPGVKLFAAEARTRALSGIA